VPELIRGKTGRVFGHLLTLLTVLKGIPLSYNRDLQEDKAPLFDAVDTVQACVGLLATLVGGLTIRRETMAKAATSGFLLATELADYLVRKGLPFRVAHAIVGEIVRDRLNRGLDLTNIRLEELRSFSKAFQKDALDVLMVEGALERKDQIGGTARKRVVARLKVLQKILKAEA
jgi:argininosuccinate lyase